MFRKVKIFPKILFNCVLIAAIPLAGFLYQVSINEKDQRAEVEKRLLQTATVITGEVNNWVDKNLRSSRLLAKLDPFLQMDPEAQVPILKAAKENLDWVSLIFVKDLNGDAIARSDGKKLRNYSDREYFKQVMSGEEIGQQVLIGKVKPVPLHCFAIPIENTVKVGVMTQCSTLIAISDYISAGKVGLTGYAFLVDDKQRLIAHGETSGKLVGKLQDFSEHPATKLPENQVSIINHEGKDRVFITRSVGPGWLLVVQQDYEEAYTSYLSAKSNAVILAVVTVVLTLLLSFLISYNISKPVSKLTDLADAYSKGIFVDGVSGQDRSDELGDLARAIFRMTKTIQIAIGRLRKLKQGA